MLFLLIFCINNGISVSQNIHPRYDFVNEERVITKDTLIVGTKRSINDSCFYLMKFVDDNFDLIVKMVYCKEAEIKRCYYRVPRKTVKYTYETNSPLPPYEFVTKTEKVYRIKRNCCR